MAKRRRSVIGIGVAVSLLTVALAATSVSRHRAPAERSHLPQAGHGRLPGLRPGQQIAWGEAQVRLWEKASSTELFATQQHILRVIWVHPPARPPQLLVLTAEETSGPQPRRSHLYLLDPSQPDEARLLSPEPAYNFWDASAGDVDGDGRQEVALCTYSHTARDPRYARRFFVYSWDEGGDLYPRWRGSRLCRPYLWARLADATGDGKHELLSVEVGLGGGQMLVAYQWNQFGFWGLGHSAEYRELTVVDPNARIADVGRGVLALVRRADGQRRPALLALREDGWQPVWWGPSAPEQSDAADQPESSPNPTIGRHLQ